MCVLLGDIAVYVDLCYLNCELKNLWKVNLTHKCVNQCQMEESQEWRKFATSSIFVINKFYALNIRI
jgi:hypothetical protein